MFRFTEISFDKSYDSINAWFKITIGKICYENTSNTSVFYKSEHQILQDFSPTVISWLITQSKYSYLRIIHQLVIIVINHINIYLYKLSYFTNLNCWAMAGDDSPKINHDSQWGPIHWKSVAPPVAWPSGGSNLAAFVPIQKANPKRQIRPLIYIKTGKLYTVYTWINYNSYVIYNNMWEKSTIWYTNGIRYIRIVTFRS
jgi:hypothetical protein